MLRWVSNALIGAPDFKGKTRLLKSVLTLLRGRPVRSRYGVDMMCNIQDFTNYACISGMYHVDYDDVFEEVCRLQPGMAFVDVGANAGLFSMVAGSRVGADGVVLAFEPNLAIFRDLVANATLNGLKAFFPFNAAIGEISGSARFTIGTAQHSGVAHITATGDHQVAVLNPLDIKPLLEALVGDREIMIKIDVEGAEGQVIRAFRYLIAQPRVKRMVVEIDEGNLARFGDTPASIYSDLDTLGWTPLHGLGSARHFNEVFYRV